MSLKRFLWRAKGKLPRRLIICIGVRFLLGFSFLYSLRETLCFRMVGAGFDLLLFALVYYTWREYKDFFKRLFCIGARFVWGAVWLVPINYMCVFVLLLFSLSFLRFWERWVIIVGRNLGVGVALIVACLRLGLGSIEDRFTLSDVVMSFWQDFRTLQGEAFGWMSRGGAGDSPTSAGGGLPGLPEKDLGWDGGPLQWQRLTYLLSGETVRLPEGNYWLKVTPAGTGKQLILSKLFSSDPTGWKVILPASKNLELGTYGVLAKEYRGTLELSCIFAAPLGFRE